MAFHFANSITELAYFPHSYSQDFIWAKDLFFWINLKEYLIWYRADQNIKKQPNQLSNSNNQAAIIRAAQNFQAKVMIKYEFPMMLLTRTEEIFEKRIKRLRNLEDSKGSSDDSSFSSLLSDEGSSKNTVIFLKSNVSEMSASKENEKSSSSCSSYLSSKAFDIYNPSSGIASSSISISPFEEEKDQAKHMIYHFNFTQKESSQDSQIKKDLDFRIRKSQSESQQNVNAPMSLQQKFIYRYGHQHNYLLTKQFKEAFKKQLTKYHLQDPNPNAQIPIATPKFQCQTTKNRKNVREKAEEFLIRLNQSQGTKQTSDQISSK